MEDKIKAMIHSIFRQYGADKGAEQNIKEEHILKLCMNDLATYPALENELDTGDKIRYFVIQTILYDVSMD